MTRHNGVAMSAGGEATPRREMGGDDASWTDVNLIGLKIKRIHVVDSTATNGR
jgi:hypothetical protein